MRTYKPAVICLLASVAASSVGCRQSQKENVTSSQNSSASKGASSLPTRPPLATPKTTTTVASPASTNDDSLPTVIGPVELRPQPDVIPDVLSSFPRVVPGPAVTQEIANKINAALTRDEAAAKSTALDCRAQAREMNPELKADDLETAWTRSVDVTMRGPRFLSFTLTTSAEDCGGPHPELARSSSIVYDLSTGKPVNWLRLLPRGTKGIEGELGDGLTAGWLDIPALQRRAYREADADCKDAFDASAGETVSFEVYPDARSGSLIVDTPDLRSIQRPCDTIFNLKERELKNLGAPDELWQSIAAAHILQHTK